MTKALNKLETEKISRLLASFAIPSIISLLVNSLYNIVDQIFIGRFIGELGNAATTVMFPLITISMAFALLIGNGAAAYYSLKLGQKKKKAAKSAAATTIILLIILGIILFIFSILLYKKLLFIFGASQNVMPYALEYTPIIIIGLPFAMFTTGITAVIRSDGSPKFAMYSMLFGAILNTILDPIFISTINLGIKGAAYATILSQILVFFITLYYILFKFKNIDFKFLDIINEALHFNFNRAFLLVNYGASSFFTQMAITLVQICSNNTMKYYGALSKYGSDIPIASFGIAMKVSAIMVSIILGIGLGAQPILGYNYGARKFKRVLDTYKLEIKIACMVSFTAFIIFVFFPDIIIPIFGKSDKPLYNEFIRNCFRIFLFGSFLIGFQIPSSMFFQAIGKPFKSAILSMSRQVLFFIPLLLVLPTIFGIKGALFAGPIADSLAFLVTFTLIKKEINNINNLMVEENDI